MSFFKRALRHKSFVAGGDVDNDVQQAVVAAQEYTAGALTHARRFGMGKLVPNRLFKAGA